MKKLVLILLAVVITATLWAQSPEKMSYQAVVRDDAGQLVSNTEVRIRVGILNGIEGEILWQEEQMATTNINGLLTIEIGSEVPLSIDIFSNSSSLYFKTEIDPSGGTNYTIKGTSQLLSVPYALHAKTSEMVTGIINETDPVFGASVAGGITISDTANWNNKLNSESQTLADVISINNSANGQIKNVTDPTDAKDAATKAYVDILLIKIKALESREEANLLVNGFTDPRDNNHYKVVKIGNQLWMAENLKYLPSVAGPGTGSLTTPHYYVYGYDGTSVSVAKSNANYSTYGVLYNWPAAMNGATSSTANPSGVQGVCPIGWHLPSDDEWTTLTDYLGGENVAGGLLKETGTSNWSSPNSGATNETDFTALPGGGRYHEGAFDFISFFGNWYSASEGLDNNAWNRYMNYDGTNVYKGYGSKENAFSVRCLRD